MSKTFIYLLVTIGVYLLIVKGLGKFSDSAQSSNSASSSSNGGTVTNSSTGTGLTDQQDENEVSTGAAGQRRYRMGYTN